MKNMILKNKNASKRQKIQKDELTQIINWENFEKIAVEHYSDVGSFTLKYSQVYEAQNYIKNFLKELDCSEFIGIYYDTPIYCITSLILGILSSGRSFVYITKNEADFLKESLGVGYIFHLKSTKDHGEQTKVFEIHQQSIILSKTSFRSEELNNSKFAYAVTTSGSTGQPVVVKVTHKSILLNIKDLKNILKLSSTDRVAQLTPLTFDPSYVEIFLSLLAGATLCTFADDLKNHPDVLLKVLHDKKITFISTTPSLFLHRWRLKDLEETLLSKESCLKFLLLGGEPFPDVKIIRKIKHPGTILSDTLFQVRAKDNCNEIVDDGEGILYIGSSSRICLLGKEKLADLKLPVYRNTGDIVTVNKNKLVIFKGRLDSCVKRFGAKVHLDKLKIHLQKLNFIKDVQFIFDNNLSVLNLFFTSNEFDNQKDNLVSNVWSHVKLLPTIMHPDKIHHLESFKVTDRGKICKDYLKDFCSRPPSMSACDAGSLLEKIWRDHLPVGDNGAELFGFLNLGGTSVIALQISSNLSSESGNNYPELIGMLFDNKTLLECKDYLCKNFNDINTSSKVLNRPTNLDFTSRNYLLDKYIWQKCRGRTVILNPESYELFDCKSSEEILKSIKLENVFNLNKCVDASPTIFGYSNDQSFANVSSHSGLILTVDLKTKENWKIQLPDRIEGSTLVIDNFKGIVGCHDGFIYCLHLKTGQIFWSFETGNIVKCLAAVCSEKLNIFIGSYDHFVYCISLEGSLVWKLKVDGSTLATPLVHTETNAVIFSLLNSNCISMDQKTGQVRWKYQCKSSIFSTSNISSNILILADVCGNIRGLDINNGNELWIFSISGNIFSDIVICTDAIANSFMFTSKNGFFYKYYFYETQHPKLHYKVDLGSSVVATPWVEKDLAVIVREDGNLRIIDLKDGKFLYNFILSGDSFSSPVLHNNIIVVGCRDDNLYTLYLSD
ncbi:aminoadipate-semialdehyde dehydrogenase isoform X2 [Cotesia typhae]|uniref:aminoadipate-semialdehyde dehydrogenase isoform X2 n=1 Tax=Cotesia typhae TaxID=2053667 RepID=UPI003D68C4C8